MTATQATLPRPLPLQPEELEILEPRDHMSVSQWAESFRRLSPKTSDIHGPWSNDYTPFLVEIMDSLSSPGIRQVTLSKCFQAGGTEVACNFLGWAADEAPGPMLVVMPTQIDVTRRVSTRVKPMFESTPSLLRHLGGDIDALNIGKETILDTMILYLGWSTSPAALADNPVCYVVLDEVGKYPPRSRNEADPVSLAKDRQRTFFSRACLFVNSTPVQEKDLLDREHKRGDQRTWWCPCPHCKTHHVLDWPNVEIDKDADDHFLDEEAYLLGGRSRYVCPDCGKPWTESQRWDAVSAGQWAPAGCTVDKRGRLVGDPPISTHRSYHITSMMLHPHFMTIDRLAAAWVNAQEHYRGGDIGPLQDFINGELAQPWTESEQTLDENVLESHRGFYKSRTVPEGVAMLTAGFDVQIDHVWMIVVGWGYLGESWIVAWSRLETGDTREVENFAAVADAMRMTWPLVGPGKKSARILKGGIDCAYRPEPVRLFCRWAADVDVVPVRGDPTVKAFCRPTKLSGPARGSDLAKHAGASEIRYDLNVNAYKDRLARSIAAETPGPGFLHLPADADAAGDVSIMRQLTAEKRIPIRDSRGRHKGWTWVPKTEKRPNHLTDCFDYAAAVSDLAGARLIPDPDAPAPVPRKPQVMKRYRR